jgi:hypothetical protein
VEAVFDEASMGATADERATLFEPGETPPEALSESDTRSQKVGRDRPSADLGARMAERGEPPLPGHDAHHVIPEGDPRAKIARDIAEDAGLNPRNQPEAGVHLPRSSMDPRTVPEAATRHQTLHTNEYYKELTIRMVEAKANGNVPETVEQIKVEVARGEFPHAKDPVTGETFERWLNEHPEVLDGYSEDEVEAILGSVRRRPPGGG